MMHIAAINVHTLFRSAREESLKSKVRSTRATPKLYDAATKSSSRMERAGYTSISPTEGLELKETIV